MSLPMIAPTRHPRSGTYRLRLAIPSRLRETAFRLYGVWRELIENLKTRNPREAKQLAPAAEARLLAKLRAAEIAHSGEQTPLTDKQVAALAGIVYQRELADNGDNPGDPEGWQMVLEFLGC